MFVILFPDSGLKDTVSPVRQALWFGAEFREGPGGSGGFRQVESWAGSC